MIFIPLPQKAKLQDLIEIYPFTLTIGFLNLLFFWLLFSAPQDPSLKNEYSREMITTTGRFFLEWKGQSDFGRSETELQQLGAQGLRNLDFLYASESWQSQVDVVGYQKWKREVEQLFQQQEKSAISIFGLSQAKKSPLTWLTYQFSHQDGFHILSNLIMFFIFAPLVESLVGGVLMAFVYLMGGLIGGFFFMHFDSSGFIPMVGASASVTGLMGFSALGSLRKNIPYLYFFFPLKGYYGISYLSPLWIVALFLVEDLSEVLSTPSGWPEGVAYTAHLGGALAGLLLGLAFRVGVKRSLIPKPNGLS